MATSKESPEVTPEKVEKAPALSGDIVVYHNAYVPNQRHELPKEEWERLGKEGLLGNAVYIETKKADK